MRLAGLSPFKGEILLPADKMYEIQLLLRQLYISKRGDKIPLTELNHMAYNNLTFESDRKTLRHDSYRRGRLGIWKCPC